MKENHGVSVADIRLMHVTMGTGHAQAISQAGLTGGLGGDWPDVASLVDMMVEHEEAHYVRSDLPRGIRHAVGSVIKFYLQTFPEAAIVHDMARMLRIAYPGAICHVIVRGIARRALFVDEADYQRLLVRLAECVEEHDIRMYAYCLLVNHYHLVCETPRGNISAFMRSVGTGYNLYYNKRHGKTGYVTQGRFRAKVVEGDEYLLKLSRYVHLNPVRTRGCEGLEIRERVKRLRGYRWSSYPGYLRRSRREEWMEYGPMEALVKAYAGGGPNSYGTYVEAALAENDEEFERLMERSRIAIGTDDFLQRMDALYARLVGASPRPENVRFRNTRQNLSVRKVLDVVSEVLEEPVELLRRRQYRSWSRAIAVRMLCRYAGCSRREAADVLQMGSGAAASLQHSQLSEAMSRQSDLRAIVRKAETKLEKLNT